MLKMKMLQFVVWYAQARQFGAVLLKQSKSGVYNKNQVDG